MMPMMAMRAAGPSPPPPTGAGSSSGKPKPMCSCRFKPTTPFKLNIINNNNNYYYFYPLLSLIPTPDSALALTKEDIVTSLTKVEDAVEGVEQVGSTAFRFLVENVKPGIDASLPLIKKAGDEALRLASPVISQLSKQAETALQSAGIDPKPVLTAAKTAADVAGEAAQQTTRVIEGAKPIASATVETLSSSDPIVIVVAAGALLISYPILPPIWSAISFSLRGYKGDLTPAQTLDLVSKQDHLIIDIRTEKEKNKAGIPQLPSSAKDKLIAIPVEEIPNKIRGLVRSAKKVEAEIAALKISYLKRVNKGSNLVIMDSYTDTSKMVARTLTDLGFKNSWIMADGFSGRKGWLQNRLGMESYNVSIAEVLSPSRVIPAAIRRFGTISSRAPQTSQRLLPGSVDD